MLAFTKRIEQAARTNAARNEFDEFLDILEVKYSLTPSELLDILLKASMEFNRLARIYD
jgi:hypothetical protein